jgi:hypothetical protein
MKFRTEIEVNPFSFSINHKSKVVLMGSCFTSNIGDKLEYCGFQTLSNPFGITFNPISLASQVSQIIAGHDFSEKDLVEFQGQYLSFDHHSSFNNQDSAAALDAINGSIERARASLKDAEVLFLSLGSAWVWERKENGEIVNNCHKIPAREFTKKLLTYSEISNALDSMMKELKLFVPNLNVVFTLSPVRHWRHGAVENAHSKSLLHSAIQSEVYKNKQAHYFPSYEIMMDDLRDYRFYANDMIHPSEKAIDYIWNKFGDAFFSSETKVAIDLVNKLRAMQNHLVKSNDEEALEKFNLKLLDRIHQLKTVYGIELS